MDAEIEVIDGELVESEHDAELAAAESSGGLLERARGVVANPRVQGAAAATASFMAGAATLALMRRAGSSTAALRNASSEPIGPAQSGWPAGPTIGPIAPGTYVVRVRAIGQSQQHG